MTKERMAEHSRWLENLAFLGGVALMLFAGFKEAMSSCTSHPFPWSIFLIASALVAPKMLGRVTAGRIWAVLGDRLPKEPPRD